jgi:hypothetical protein
MDNLNWLWPLVLNWLWPLVAFALVALGLAVATGAPLAGRRRKHGLAPPQGAPNLKTSRPRG